MSAGTDWLTVLRDQFQQRVSSHLLALARPFSLEIAAAMQTIRQNPPMAVGAGIVALVGLTAVFGPELVPYDPATQNAERSLQSPSLAHPMGTDQFGRDMLSRVVHGARISIGIAIAVTTIRVGVGTLVGVVAGAAGGWVDEALMRLVDIQLAFPGLILALIVAGVLGESLRNLMLALAVVGWGSYARIVRGTVLTIGERTYVTAAGLYGTPRRRLFRRHFLPHIASPVLVIATLNLGTVVLATAGLSFIGLGAQPPTPEWGTMIDNGQRYLVQASWLVNAPGLAIVLTVLGFNLLGDGLRDRLDPQQQTRLEEV